MSTDAPTAKQLELMREVDAHWQGHDTGPSTDELCHMLGVVRATLSQHTAACLDDGWLTRDYRVTDRKRPIARTLRLTDKGREMMTDNPHLQEAQHGQEDDGKEYDTE